MSLVDDAATQPSQAVAAPRPERDPSDGRIAEDVVFKELQAGEEGADPLAAWYVNVIRAAPTQP